VADSLVPEAVAPLLKGGFGRPYRYEQSCPSTQRLLAADDPEGAVAVADEQTEGRGRLGRSWNAPPGTSILVSILLRPDVEPPRLPELSIVGGRAVATAIEAETGVAAGIKFPNDVLIGDRKVAGILAEASDDRVVLGIGINVNQTVDQLPVDAQTDPTSLRIETDQELDRAPLLATVLARLEEEYVRWLGEAKRPADVPGSVDR
jgi:BirA family transcriptional regulator, biotin operon repressor / biotin---[acetyl-CoA-carboxylase] ligase